MSLPEQSGTKPPLETPEATSPLVLAVDAGGTAVKVVLVDAAGRAEAEQAAEVETHHYADGRVERDADAFWQATARAIRTLLAAHDPARIRAIGCTGFGNGIFLVDADGRPTRPGIVSVDHRGQPLVDALMASGGAAEIARLNGHRPWGGQTVVQLAHLARAEPEVMARTRWGLACKDFIRLRLTGEALTDPTDASGGGLMDLERGAYSAAVLAAFGVPQIAAVLPPVIGSSAVGGRVSAAAARETGLAEGLPVAGGMMDVAACALGAGIVDGSRLVMIAGTWAINGLEVPGTRPERPPILNMLHRDGATRLVAEGSPSSAANLGWYLERAMGRRLSPAEATAKIAGSEVLARRCHFMPYVHGPQPRQGAFVGLTATDGEASMIRAICEGVAFQHRRHAEEILPHAGGRWPEAIRLAGGAARSAPWAQIFADVCQRPVEVVEAGEVGALGAAMCASVAGGLHADLVTAARAMSRIRRRHEPETAFGAFYDDRYRQFLQLDAGLVALAAGLA